MVSIIVCSHRPTRAAFIREHYAALFRGRDYEFILIEDAGSLCDGYMRGVIRSRGEQLILSHDDIEFILPDTAARIEANLANFDVIGVAGTTKVMDGSWYTAGDPFSYQLVAYPEDATYALHLIGDGPLVVPGIQALDGCFIACRREVVEHLGFDWKTFDGFHLYDIDFTFRAALAGYALAVCRDMPLIHLSRGGLKHDVWVMYCERFQAKHREMLAPGEPNPTLKVVMKGSREQIAMYCRSDNMLQAIRQLEAGRAQRP